MGIFGGFVVLFLLAVLAGFVRVDVAGLRHLAANLLERGLIDETDVGPVTAAAQRISRWRKRGALLGFLASAAVTIPTQHRVTVSLFVLMAGAVTGMTCAEWWAGRGSAGGRRSASLGRRTLVSVVGRRPVAVTAGSAIVLAGAVLASAAVRPTSGSTWTVHPASNEVCSNDIGSRTGLLFSGVLGVVAVVLGLGCAVAVTRRPVNHSIPAVADAVLRQAGVRSALGAVIVVTTLEASALLYALPLLLDEPCSSLGEPRQALAAVLQFGGFAGAVAAIGVLVRYVLRPVRWPEAAEQVAVA